MPSTLIFPPSTPPPTSGPARDRDGALGCGCGAGQQLRVQGGTVEDHFVHQVRFLWGNTIHDEFYKLAHAPSTFASNVSFRPLFIPLPMSPKQTNVKEHQQVGEEK